MILALLSLLSACDDVLLDVEFENDAVGNFDALWHEFDRYYALFGVREVDWDSLYAVYRPRVDRGSTDSELYDAMTGLLSHLNDAHVALYATGFPVFVSGDDDRRLLFSDSDPDSVSSDYNALVQTAFYGYLDSVFVSARTYGYPSGFAAHGIIDGSFTNKVLGYVFIRSFMAPGGSESYYDPLVDAFRDCDGIIVDLRFNGGGLSSYSEALVNRFADAERPYIVERNRNGPGRSDLSEPRSVVMQPAEKSLRGIPLVVLTGGATTSAAEHVVLGARELPLATVIGDTTNGALGAVATKVLPNGWEFSLSPMLVTTVGGVSYEGIGIPPDVRVLASRAEVDTGVDAVIDMAISILEATP